MQFRSLSGFKSAPRYLSSHSRAPFSLCLTASSNGGLTTCGISWSKVRSSASVSELAGHPGEKLHLCPHSRKAALKASREMSPKQAKTPASVLRFSQE